MTAANVQLIERSSSEIELKPAEHIREAQAECQRSSAALDRNNTIFLGTAILGSVSTVVISAFDLSGFFLGGTAGALGGSIGLFASATVGCLALTIRSKIKFQAADRKLQMLTETYPAVRELRP